MGAALVSHMCHVRVKNPKNPIVHTHALTLNGVRFTPPKNFDGLMFEFAKCPCDVDGGLGDAARAAFAGPFFDFLAAGRATTAGDSAAGGGRRVPASPLPPATAPATPESPGGCACWSAWWL